MQISEVAMRGKDGEPPDRPELERYRSSRRQRCAHLAGGVGSCAYLVSNSFFFLCPVEGRIHGGADGSADCRCLHRPSRRHAHLYLLYSNRLPHVPLGWLPPSPSSMQFRSVRALLLGLIEGVMHRALPLSCSVVDGDLDPCLHAA